MAEKSVQPGLALDLRGIGRGGSGRQEWDHADWAVFQTLMRADGIVERPEFPKEMIEVPFAEDGEVIETLIADCLDEAFGKGVEVRRFGWKFLHFSVLAFNHRVKFVGELGVAGEPTPVRGQIALAMPEAKLEIALD